MVTQLHRPEAERLDGALVAAALDVFPDPERVVEQIEHAADYVLDHRLCTEADRYTDDTGACDQWSNLNAERRQGHHNGDRHEQDH